MVGRLLKRGAVVSASVVLLEALYAVLRPTPELESYDPSGEFGDQSLPDLRVAVLGDSSVNAPGVEGPEDIWVSIVAERLANASHVVLKSFAVGGSRAQDVLREQVDPAIEYEPDLVFVSVGANDAIKGVSRGDFFRTLDQVVSRLRASGAPVVQSGVGDLGTIPRLYPPLRQIMSHRGLLFDSVHRQVAARHGSHVVDQRSDYAGIWLNDRELWAADLFHVSAKGHARWADTTWRTVEPLVLAHNAAL